jgi:hypothetical protein
MMFYQAQEDVNMRWAMYEYLASRKMNGEQ